MGWWPTIKKQRHQQLKSNGDPTHNAFSAFRLLKWQIHPFISNRYKRVYLPLDKSNLWNMLKAYLTFKLTHWPRKFPFIINIHVVAEIDYSIKRYHKDVLHFFSYYFIKNIFSHFWLFDDFGVKLALQMSSNMTLNHQNSTIIGFVQSKSHEKKVLHMLPDLFVKDDIYLTLKFNVWPWRWPWLFKLILEIDCPVKITWQRDIVPSFNCLKIILDLEITPGIDH